MNKIRKEKVDKIQKLLVNIKMYPPPSSPHPHSPTPTPQKIIFFKKKVLEEWAELSIAEEKKA